jgi:hypothetical protein
MRYAKWISGIMLFVLPTIAAAQMPAANRIVADVPFTFVVGDTVIPLGECIVQKAGVSQALLVRSPGAKLDVFATAIANDQRHAAGTYSLVFHKYGRRYFLAAVKLEGSRTVYSFTPSKFEKELLAQNVPATEQILVASLK